MADKPVPRLKNKTIRCPKCEKEWAITRNFYKYGGDFQTFSKYGFYPVCKSCLESDYLEFNPIEKENIKKYIYMVCQTLNKPFVNTLFENSYKLGDNVFKSYFKKVANATYNTKAFVDSDDIRIGIKRELDRDLTSEEISRWQIYNLKEDSDILKHEYIYQSIKKEHSIPETIDNIDGVCNLVVLKVRLANESASGEIKTIKDLQVAIKAAENSLDITKTKSEAAGGANSFGSLIAMMEASDPYFEEDKRLEDYDGLLHTAKAVLGSTAVAFGRTDKKKFRDNFYRKYEVE